jgi:hypothetical protein
LPLQINGEASVPLAQFKSGLAPYLVTNLGEWCNLCENTETRGCDLIELVNATTESASVTSTVGRHRTSPVVSGVIGALVGLVLAAIAFAVLEGVRSRRDRSRSARRGPADGDSVRPTRSASLPEPRVALTSPSFTASHQTYELNGAPSLDSKSDRRVV